MKKIIILKHNQGRLGNQLFYYSSIYAFCLEMGLECRNYSFYNYRKYFSQKPSDKLMAIIDLLGLFQLYQLHSTHLVIYRLYEFFIIKIVRLLNRGIIVHDPKHKILLPPTKAMFKINKEIVNKIIKMDNNVFFMGSDFQNPVGLKKYHKQIKKLFSFRESITKKVENFLKPFKKYYLVGVHIRQGDYKKLMQGKWYFTSKEVAEILKKYLARHKNRKKETLFIICSDSKINLKHFKGLKIKPGIGSMMEDLLTLSKCNLIIGSNSTFSKFASYYGKVPYIIFNKKHVKKAT